MRAHTDQRSFITALAQAGELLRVEREVDWNLEAGAVSRLACERRAPAPLFVNVKDYPGAELAAVLLGPGCAGIHSRVAIALGLAPDIHPLDLIDEVRARLKKPLPPVRVERTQAACKEVVITDPAQLDLRQFPMPWIKSIDGGRYVGTWDIVVTKDMQDGWTNWATYRCQYKDPQHFNILLLPSEQHGGGMFRKYEAAGKPMPIALVIGADPSVHLAGMTPLGYGECEADAAGGLRQSPVPVVKCETSDLEVPADAEIVIEAEVLPGIRGPEGPFGEFTGHSVPQGQSPVARVTCITHRRNPVFPMANMGKPWDDCAAGMSIMLAAAARNRLERDGLPVKAIYCFPPILPVVAVKPELGLTKRIVGSLMAGARMFLTNTGIIFVDEDVDVTNVQDVMWAMATRLHPSRFEVVANVPANSLVPYLEPEERQRHLTSQWVMDATFPAHWPPEYRARHSVISDFSHGWSEEVQAKVLANWGAYGYGAASAPVAGRLRATG